MVGAGCSVVASILLSKGKLKAARLNVTQAMLFVTIVSVVPSVLMMIFSDATARMLGASDYLLPMVKEYLLWFIPNMDFRIALYYPIGWCSEVGNAMQSDYRNRQYRSRLAVHIPARLGCNGRGIRIVA